MSDSVASSNTNPVKFIELNGVFTVDDIDEVVEKSLKTMIDSGLIDLSRTNNTWHKYDPETSAPRHKDFVIFAVKDQQYTDDGPYYSGDYLYGKFSSEDGREFDDEQVLYWMRPVVDLGDWQVSLKRQHYIECLTLLQKRCKDSDLHLLFGKEGWDFVDDWQTADEAVFDGSLDELVDDILITGVFQELEAKE